MNPTATTIASSLKANAKPLTGLGKTRFPMIPLRIIANNYANRTNMAKTILVSNARYN